MYDYELKYIIIKKSVSSYISLSHIKLQWDFILYIFFGWLSFCWWSLYTN